MSPGRSPLWELKPTRRFAERAADYARNRPDYPPEAVTAILAGRAAASGITVADVGAGTGIASRLLADRGARVIALEPNPQMRAAATPHPRVEYRDGRAERTGLPAASVDVVLCAQSFHWFEPRAALAEFRRVLRPGGRLAVLWNERNEDDAFTAAYSGLVRAAAGGHLTEARTQGVDALLAGGGFPGVRRLVFAHGQSLTAAGLVGRARSASYVPRRGREATRLAAGLRALHARYADDSGRVTLRYRSVLYLAE